MRRNGLGYNPDAKDGRDYKFGSLVQASTPPPRSSILRPYAGRLLDQEDSEGCVGWSFANGIWAHWNYLSAQQGKPQPVAQPSPLFHWWLARQVDGDTNINTGTYIRNAIKQCAALGVCPESRWPSTTPTEYFDGVPRYAQQPSVEAFQHAADQRAPLGYHRVGEFFGDRRAELSLSISRGSPVVLGTQVTTAFLQLLKHDPLPPPAPTDEIAGGHALCVLTYDENGVYGPNTWQDAEKGFFWGNDGWFALSWEYVLWPYTQDLWSISAELPGAWS